MITIVRIWHVFWVLAFAGTLTFATPAVAQSDDANGTEIVVPGDRPLSAKEIKRQARQITGDRNLRRQPLARFEEPVCPGVIGLPFDLASPIILRVRAVAETIGIETAQANDCKPNIIVAFTGNGKADLAELAKRDISMISGLSYWERKKLLAEDGPVRAFSMVATVSNTGMRSFSGMTQTTIASRLILSVRRDIETAVVLIDADVADGKTVMQLADYAAMRSFARTKPPKGDVYYGTILQLFEDVDRVPQRLTDFDISYLRAVYSGQAARAGISTLKRVKGELSETEGQGSSD